MRDCSESPLPVLRQKHWIIWLDRWLLQNGKIVLCSYISDRHFSEIIFCSYFYQCCPILKNGWFYIFLDKFYLAPFFDDSPIGHLYITGFTPRWPFSVHSTVRKINKPYFNTLNPYSGGRDYRRFRSIRTLFQTTPDLVRGISRILSPYILKNI